MNQNQNIFVLFLRKSSKGKALCLFISNMPKRALRPKGLEKRFHQGCADKRREGIPNEYRAFILGQLLTESISYNSHNNSRTHHRRKWGSGSLGASLKHMDQSWDANTNLPVPKAHTPSARPSPPILERILFFFFFFLGKEGRYHLFRGKSMSCEVASEVRIKVTALDHEPQ